MYLRLLLLIAFTIHSASAWLTDKKYVPVGPVRAPRIITPPDLTVNETELLNYALALENLQSAFYERGLAEFDEEAFKASGFPCNVRDGYALIALHKQVHVALLNQTLGITTSQPCDYSFPFNDVTSFTQMSQSMENIGTSAYIGIMPGLKNSTYITAAASILSVDARYASWIASNVTGVRPWSGAFDPPLMPQQVITLAIPYVSSCPSTNLQLPFRSLPNLTLTPQNPTPGSTVTLTLPGDSNLLSQPVYAVFLQGLDQTIVPVTHQEGNTNLFVSLPSNLTGTVFVILTNDSLRATNETMIAGPGILTCNTPFNETINATATAAPTSTVLSTVVVGASQAPTSVLMSTVVVIPTQNSPVPVSTVVVIPTTPVPVSTVVVPPTAPSSPVPVSTVVVAPTA